MNSRTLRRRASQARRTSVAAAAIALTGGMVLVDMGTPSVAHAAGPTDPTGEYTPLTPAVIATGTLQANTTQGFQVFGVGGVPMTGVKAVVVNLTFTYESQAAVFSVWDFDKAKPPETATGYYQPQQWISYQATVSVGPSGKIAVQHSSGTASVAIHVQGYYSTVSGPAGSRYRPVNPARVIDTGCTYRTREFSITGAGGVPANATAVVMNLTGIACNGPTYIRAYPADVTTAWPDNFTSQLLYTERWTSLQATVRLPQGGAKDGRVAIDVGPNFAWFKGDVVGYYQSSDKSTEAGRFVPIEPARLYNSANTAQGPFAAGSARVLRVGGLQSFPPFGVSAVSLTAHAFQVTTGGALTIYPSNIASPGTSSVEYPFGTYSANAVTTKVQESTVSAQDGNFTIASSGATQVAVDSDGYFTR